MIPKIIHYCWFGGGKKPKVFKKCLKSWKKFCPDYKIICWNEDNYDFKNNEYCKAAYAHQKWAFLTDYVRLDVVYKYGGIYLDIDVELLDSLDAFLNNRCFMALEEFDRVATGLGFGAVKEHEFLAEHMNYYNLKFMQKAFSDDKGEFIGIPCPSVTTPLLVNYGASFPCKDIQIISKGDIALYPPEFFCPMQDKKIKSLTQNTIAMHHYYGSWVPNKFHSDDIKGTLKLIKSNGLSWFVKKTIEVIKRL